MEHIVSCLYFESNKIRVYRKQHNNCLSYFYVRRTLYPPWTREGPRGRDTRTQIYVTKRQRILAPTCFKPQQYYYYWLLYVKYYIIIPLHVRRNIILLKRPRAFWICAAATQERAQPLGPFRNSDDKLFWRRLVSRARIHIYIYIIFIFSFCARAREWRDR